MIIEASSTEWSLLKRRSRVVASTPWHRRRPGQLLAGSIELSCHRQMVYTSLPQRRRRWNHTGNEVFMIHFRLVNSPVMCMTCWSVHFVVRNGSNCQLPCPGGQYLCTFVGFLIDSLTAGILGQVIVAFQSWPLYWKKDSNMRELLNKFKRVVAIV